MTIALMTLFTLSTLNLFVINRFSCQPFHSSDPFNTKTMLLQPGNCECLNLAVLTIIPCMAINRMHVRTAVCMFAYGCICLRSYYVVLLSCLLSFVVLPVSFYSDFTLLPVLCLIRAPSQSSRLVFAWPRLALICHVLFCSCRFRLPLRVAFSLCFLRVVFL